jgi:glycosyltransferase involved in cell wall biosynthesis
VGFLLPGTCEVPVGGVKVALEYANALVQRGWAVRVVMPLVRDREAVARLRASAWRRLRKGARFLARRWRGSYLPAKWFDVDGRVEMRFTLTPEARYLPPADAWVATSWRTAGWVAGYPGARLYLIQHLETWDGPEAEVLATWKLPLRKVVIARWLEATARGMGEDSVYIPNGLDFRAFGVDVAPEERSPDGVLMLFHKADWKGSGDGIAALEQARREHPGLRAVLYGVPDRPESLPAWIGYERQPTQARLRELYNQAAIFLAPSWTEGWPLPPAEAMACGCALVATDIGGHREYAHDGATALLAPPRSPQALAAHLVRLLGDRDLRVALARAGHDRVRRFTWEPAVDRLEQTLREAISAGRGAG